MTWQRRMLAAARSGRRSSCAAFATAGVSALEALVVVTLVGIMALPAAVSLVDWTQRQRLDAAIRHLSHEVARSCAFAVASGRTHGLRLRGSPAELTWALVADGDGDGLSSADLDAGIDPAVEPTARLTMRFPGLLPGRPAGVPTVAGGAADLDGLAFGGGAALSCSSDGGARSGTLYLRATGGYAAALRIYGPTARITLWWWDRQLLSWVRLR